MLRGRRDRYHRLGFIIPFTVAAIATPIQMARRRHARPLGLQQRAGQVRGDRARAEDRRATCPRRCSATSTRTGQVSGGIPIPGLASWLSDPSDGKSTVVAGPRRVPGRRAADDPRGRTSCTSRGTSWSGSARCCSCCRSGTALSLAVPARHAEDASGSCASPPCAGVLAVVTHGSGLGRHRGRPPTVDRPQLHEGRGGRDDEHGVWITFLVDRRHLRRGRRHADPGAARHEPALARRQGERRRDRRAVRPARRSPAPSRPTRRCRSDEHDAVAVVLFFGVTAYAVFGGADFGAGFWDLVAGGAERGERPARGHRPLDRPGVGGEPRLADLLPRRAVDRRSPRRSRRSRSRCSCRSRSPRSASCCAGRASRSARRCSAPASQRNFGAAFASSSVLVPYCMGAVAGAIASGRVPAGGKAGDPWSSWVNPTSILGGVLAVAVCAYLARSTSCGTPRRLERPEMVEYFRRRAIGAAVVAGRRRVRRDLRAPRRRRATSSTASRRARLPLVIVSAVCGVGSLVLLVREPHQGARLLGHRRGRDRRGRLGRRAVAVHAPDVAEGVAAAAPDGDARGGARRVRASPRSSSCRRSACSTCSTRRACCPRRAQTSSTSAS